MLEQEIAAKVIREVALACKGLNVEFFVVGAFAQKAWYQIERVPFRGTNDIDFAVAIPDGSTYERLRDRLAS